VRFEGKNHIDVESKSIETSSVAAYIASPSGESKRDPTVRQHKVPRLCKLGASVGEPIHLTLPFFGRQGDFSGIRIQGSAGIHG
jgi:hypothetical protein